MMFRFSILDLLDQDRPFDDTATSSLASGGFELQAPQSLQNFLQRGKCQSFIGLTNAETHLLLTKSIIGSCS
jgi:hypothetical protein